MGFVPPPYPYDRLEVIAARAADRFGSALDLSIGTPGDPPPAAVMAALGATDARGYPPSIGSLGLREAVSGWFDRRLGVTVGPDAIRACIGTKEFVAGLPQWLKLRTPERNTVLFPAVSYPSYAMGATLAGCRPVAVPVDDQFCLDLDAIDPADADRALCLWVNTPGNPAGNLDDLGAAAAWGRAHGVPVFSDECYIEFTWTGPPRTILEHGLDGVVAVHSLSKRSNLAGARLGYFAGDPQLVRYLGEVRKHAGFMVPAPVQAAGVVALADQVHVDDQRQRYHERLTQMAGYLTSFEVAAPLPDGGFYLWVPAPRGDAWGFAGLLADRLGIVVSPGEFYGEAGSGHVRIAVVKDVSVVAERLVP